MTRLGILGLPNVGKSTLFNLLTGQAVPAENYPFCTIEPNVGVAALPDPRTKKISELTGAPTLMEATIELVDVAGLIENASQGAGLGNQFLGHIRDAQGLIHVVAAFDPVSKSERQAEEVVHDIKIIEQELMMADIDVVDRHRIHAKGSARSSQDPKALFLFDTLDKVWRAMKFDGQPASSLNLSETEWELLRTYDFLTAKPRMILINVQEGDVRDVASWKATLGSQHVALLAAAPEIELAQIHDAHEQKVFRESLDVPGSISEMYEVLKQTFSLRTFFTFGKGITRAWLIKTGATAQEAAGLIHEDFRDRFVRAQVYRPEDLIQYGLEEVERRELFKIQDKNYEVRDGDILWFVTT